MTTATAKRNTSKRNTQANADASTGEGRELIQFQLNEQTAASGALFNIEERSENGPIMSGSLEIDGKKVPWCGFLKTAGTSGLEYLALSIGEENGTHYYGKLFRVSDKKNTNAPDYTGFITLLPCTAPNQYTTEQWDEAATLKVAGWRKRSAEGRGRIHAVISSPVVKEGELNF